LRFTIDVVIDSITGSVLRPEYSADENGALIRAGSGKDIETMGEDVDAEIHAGFLCTWTRQTPTMIVTSLYFNTIKICSAG